jgi:hypothetical protein
MQKKSYESPEIVELGSLEELTEANNKIGRATDIFSALTNGAVIGSLVGLPPL